MLAKKAELKKNLKLKLSKTHAKKFDYYIARRHPAVDQILYWACKIQKILITKSS